MHIICTVLSLHEGVGVNRCLLRQSTSCRNLLRPTRTACKNLRYSPKNCKVFHNMFLQIHLYTKCKAFCSIVTKTLLTLIPLGLPGLLQHSCKGKALVYCSKSDPPFQHPSISFPWEDKQCDTPIVRAHSSFPLLKMGTCTAVCQSISAPPHSTWKRRISKDSPTVSSNNVQCLQQISKPPKL